MAAKEEQNLVLRVIKHGLENREVTLRSPYRDLHLQSDEADYLRTFLINWGAEAAPNHILTIPNMQQGAGIQPEINLQLLPNAVFSYIDHLEIIEARKAAKEAKRISWIAIFISILLGALQLYIEAYN